ncbi:MAG: HEAT repeat domain-containing protein [Pyrinomonadaceae bacterium]
MMAGHNSNIHRNRHAAETDAPPPRKRSPWPLAVIAALFIVVPFLSWYGTWFGRTLSDADVEKYLRDDEKPRHIQHALSQAATRIAQGDEGVRRWYPQIIALAGSPSTDVRMTAAWVMGEDNRAEDFHAALLRLIEDREPIVRRNAALALVRFGDRRGRHELLAMLRPYPVTSPHSGTAMTVLTESTPVARESMLARIRSADERYEEIRSPLPGRIKQSLVKEGDAVAAGQELFVLAPDIASVWETLRALYLVGEAEDLADVERYARGVEGVSDQIKKQAALTAEAIRRRSSQKDDAATTDPR